MTTVSVVNHNIGAGSSAGARYVAKWFYESDAVTLQECLEPEFERWLDRGWFGSFAAMRGYSEHPSGFRKGLAILSRYPVLETSVVALGVGGLVNTDKEFNLLGVSIDHPAFRDKSASLWVTTTHLWSAGRDEAGNLYSYDTNKAVRLHQAKRLARHLEPLVGTNKYVLTGDFNSSPRTPVIDQIHGISREGHINTRDFWEADQFYTGTLRRGGRDTVGGRNGHGRKIDYWFASRGGMDPRNGIELDLRPAPRNGGARHDWILRGRATWPGVSR